MADCWWRDKIIIEDNAQRESSLRDVPASEILAKIEKGIPVEYDHSIIRGDLDTCGLNLKKSNEKFIIVAQINIKSCTFEGNVRFENVIFKKRIEFRETRFKGNVNFFGSCFNDDIYFCGSEFNVDAIFTGSNFDGIVDFNRSHFIGVTYFIESKFSGHVEFIESQFDKMASFDFSCFHDSVYFAFSDFIEGISFSESRFDGLACFVGSKFYDGAEFLGAQFSRHADITHCSFHRYLILEDSKIYSMSLLKTIFENNSKIILNKSEFFRLEVLWKNVKNKLEYDGSAYLALVKNYNNLEWFEDADRCYYQYRCIRRKKCLQGLEWAVDLIPWWFYGYGVRFYYPLVWLFVAYILSSIIYLWYGQARFPGVLDLSAVILITTTQINGLDGGQLTGICRICSIIERILGWVLMSTFLVALAKKTLR